MGFDSIASIDATAFEGSTHVIDLNHRKIPLELQQQFDVLLDIGTMEHVFHVPNYLANVFDLVKVGGIVWQTLPANNWVNHGFYQFSPTLLNDFYVQNGWKIMERHLFQIDSHWAKVINQYFFEDEANYVNPLQELDGQYYFSSIIVQKTHESTCDRIPQQYTYLKHQWTNEKSEVRIRDIVKIKTKIDLVDETAIHYLILALIPKSIKNVLKNLIFRPLKRSIEWALKKLISQDKRILIKKLMPVTLKRAIRSLALSAEK